MVGTEQGFHPFNGQPGNPFDILRVVHNNPLHRLAVAARGSIPNDIEHLKNILLCHRILCEMSNGPPFLQVIPDIFGGQFTGISWTLLLLVRPDVQDEGMRRAGHFAVSAGNTHARLLIPDHGKGILICRVDN
ncbi:hypothetical protein MKMG_02163 [Methanogenium sp. MK-MG]|nr:hypothetical protein MKMG_02163 [Methanogenium sp. MK-MG]